MATMNREQLAAAVEDCLEQGGYLMFRFGHGQIRQLKAEETDVVLAALRSTPPEAGAITADELIFRFCEKERIEPDGSWLRRDDVEEMLRHMLNQSPPQSREAK